ncbi:GNAT family N-acetyltransferase [Mesobacterium pallidum]|uniref:GNAT family N-acetyltransferase n=1 Tax=Mesobacterium pallidum TaxID=2872037 RepID=UPI001EE29596|nr:GNAT family N-acetyltransferase [Mesobacterium pallidum]
MTSHAAHIPVIETGRLTLRAIGEDDLDALAAFYEGDRSSFVGGPLDRARCWQMIAGNLGHWLLRGYGMWVIDGKETGTPIGLVGFIYREGWQEPELGWQIWDGEGKGYAHEAAAAARAHGAAQFGLDSVISYIHPANARSQALARRLGAAPESKHVLLGTEVDVWRHPKAEGTA